MRSGALNAEPTLFLESDMNQIPLSNVRSFVLVGHTGSGKTAITDALAYKLGLNDRLGSTANGSSVPDFTEEEKEILLPAMAFICAM